MIKAYLQIALYVKNTGAGFYARYKEPFLKTIAGAKSKELLVRDEDVQVLHGFGSVGRANAYLKPNFLKKTSCASLARCLTRLLRSGFTRWLKFDLARVGAGSVRAKFDSKGGAKFLKFSRLVLRFCPTDSRLKISPPLSKFFKILVIIGLLLRKIFVIQLRF